MLTCIFLDTRLRSPLKPKGLNIELDWPRVVSNPENLRNTRRWCQKSKRNYLQDAWNGRYEFYMFEAREKGSNAISAEFCLHMNEEEEEDDSRSESPNSDVSVTWANEMQLTEGEEPEELPFSEDEESIAIDFPDEELNLWDDFEWRDRYAVAINEAYGKVYERNEAVKNDPTLRLKPVDIDPHWSFLLQQIAQRNKDEADEVNELQEREFEIEIGDRSDVTSTSIHGYDTDNNTITTEAESANAEDEVDLNEALIGSEAESDETTPMTTNELATTIAIEANETDEVRSEGSAEVLIIERQEEVMELQVEPEQGEVREEDSREREIARNRFDFQSFKARLIEFKNRLPSDISNQSLIIKTSDK